MKAPAPAPRSVSTAVYSKSPRNTLSASLYRRAATSTSTTHVPPRTCLAGLRDGLDRPSSTDANRRRADHRPAVFCCVHTFVRTPRSDAPPRPTSQIRAPGSAGMRLTTHEVTGNSTEQEGCSQRGFSEYALSLGCHRAPRRRAEGPRPLGKNLPRTSAWTGVIPKSVMTNRAPSRVSYDIVRPFHPFQIAVETDETDALRMSMGKRTNAFRNRT